MKCELCDLHISGIHCWTHLCSTLHKGWAELFRPWKLDVVPAPLFHTDKCTPVKDVWKRWYSMLISFDCSIISTAHFQMFTRNMDSCTEHEIWIERRMWNLLDTHFPNAIKSKHICSELKINFERIYFKLPRRAIDFLERVVPHFAEQPLKCSWKDFFVLWVQCHFDFTGRYSHWALY